MIRPARHLLGFNTQVHVITLWCFYISGAHTRTAVALRTAESYTAAHKVSSAPYNYKAILWTLGRMLQPSLSPLSLPRTAGTEYTCHICTPIPPGAPTSACVTICRRPQGSFTAPSQLLHSSWCSLIPLMQRPDIQLDLVVRLVASGPPVHLLQRLGHQLRHLDIGDQRHAVVHGEAANRVIQQEAL